MSGGGVPRAVIARQALEVVAGRWVLDVAERLAGNSSMRYGELLDAISEIPEGSLSRTLRQMERDGLVRRMVRPTMPVQVEYELTALGTSVIGLLKVLADWTVERGSEVEAAREVYQGPQD